MDPPLLLPGEEKTPGKITIEEFVNIYNIIFISKIITN